MKPMTRAQIIASLEFNRETLMEAQAILARIQTETVHDKIVPYYKERYASAQRLVNDIMRHQQKLQDDLAALDAQRAKAKEPETCHGFKKTGHVFATTLGWDGKDYEGIGKTWPCWETPSHPGQLFIRIYIARYKEWGFLKVTSRNSAAGAPVVEFHCSFPRYQ